MLCKSFPFSSLCLHQTKLHTPLALSSSGTVLGKKKNKNEANTLLISMAEGVTFCLHHHYLMINIFRTSDNLGKGVLIFFPWAISWVVLKKRELSSFLVQIVQGKGTYLLFK